MNIPKQIKRQQQEISVINEKKIKKYFEDLGYDVEDYDKNTSQKAPDFKISKGNIILYAEVKTFFDPDALIKRNISQQLIEDNFHPKIDYGWRLHLPKNIINNTLENIKKEIKKFQLGVEKYLKVKYDPEFISQKLGVVLKLSEENKGTNVSYRHGSILNVIKVKIRGDLKEAVKQFKFVKNENVPRLLIICKKDVFVSENFIKQAIMGDYFVTFFKDGYIDDTMKHGKNRSFQKNKNTRISAICLYSDGFGIDSVKKYDEFIVFHNPFAKDVFPLEILNQNQNTQFHYLLDSKRWEVFR